MFFGEGCGGCSESEAAHEYIAVEGTITSQAGRSRACRTLTGALAFLGTRKAAARLVSSFGGCTSRGQPGESPGDCETAGNEELQQAI